MVGSAHEEGTDGGKTSVFQGGADFSDGNFFGAEPRLTPPVEQDRNFDPINEAKNHSLGGSEGHHIRVMIEDV